MHLFLSICNALTQSTPHTNICIIFVDNEALWGSITLLLALNVDSKLTVVTGVDNISLANLDKIRYLNVFAFHQSSALKFTHLSIISTFSSKYNYKSDLIGYYKVSTFRTNYSYNSKPLWKFIPTHWLNYHLPSNLEHCFVNSLQ